MIVKLKVMLPTPVIFVLFFKLNFMFIYAFSYDNFGNFMDNFCCLKILQWQHLIRAALVISSHGS